MGREKDTAHGAMDITGPGSENPPWLTTTVTMGRARRTITATGRTRRGGVF
jgi:hypothetical protein